MKTTLTGQLYVLAFCLTVTFAVRAQTETPCGTERIDTLAAAAQPYYGNNAFLTRLADSVEAAGCTTCRTAAGGLATEAYVIPVRIWVYRTDAGAGGIADERANLMNQRLRAAAFHAAGPWASRVSAQSRSSGVVSFRLR